MGSCDGDGQSQAGPQSSPDKNTLDTDGDWGWKKFSSLYRALESGSDTSMVMRESGLGCFRL